VRVARVQPQTTFEQDAGIHAGQDRHVPLRSDRKVSQIEVSYKLLVGFQQFVGD
jgi:hypothetical protein